MKLSYDPTRISYTVHACQRMAERRITRQLVEEVLREGYLVRYDEHRRLLAHVQLGFRIVVDPLTGHVLTVMPPTHDFVPTSDDPGRLGGRKPRSRRRKDRGHPADTRTRTRRPGARGADELDQLHLARRRRGPVGAPT